MTERDESSKADASNILKNTQPYPLRKAYLL